MTKTPTRTAKAPRKSLTKVEQREVSLEKISNAALKVFVSKGYRATTVDDIAMASSMTKGAIYFYFPTKAAVLLALFDQIEKVMVDDMLQRVASAGPSPADQLVAFLHSGAGTGDTKPEMILLYILMLLEFNGVGDEIEARIKAIYTKIHEAIGTLVAAGQQLGTFRRDLEARETASIMMALYHGTFMEWYCRSQDLRGRELVKAARSIATAGVLAGT
jgi:AcrR family transcriptional regulator